MIITKDILNKINEKINALLKEKDQVIIAIEGPAGTGKTTLATNLNGYVFHIDDYFNKTRNEEIGSNINKEYILNNILKPLLNNGENFNYQTYSCKTNEYKENTYTKHNIIIFEGVYSYLPCFQKYYDLLIYCDIEKPEQDARLKNRPNYNDFIYIWLPKEEKYFKEINPKAKANLILK